MSSQEYDTAAFYNIKRHNIRKYSKDRGLTAAALAEKAGLGHDYLRQVESAKDRHHVSLISLYKISQALEVGLDKLVTERPL